MIIGLYRERKTDEEAETVDSLLAAGCERLDKIENGQRSYDYLKALPRGTTIVVSAIKDIGETAKEILTTIKYIGEAGIDLKSLKEPLLDTTEKDKGELIFSLVTSILASEEKPLGRHKMDAEKVAKIKTLFRGGRSPTEIAAILGLSTATVYKYTKSIDPTRKGTTMGRPTVERAKIAEAIALYDEKKLSIKEITQRTGIASGTLYKYLGERESDYAAAERKLKDKELEK